MLTGSRTSLARREDATPKVTRCPHNKSSSAVNLALLMQMLEMRADGGHRDAPSGCYLLRTHSEEKHAHNAVLD